MIEIPLTGGNTNASVVRVGDTVRRAMTASSPTVHGLLRHLERQGFAASPRFLGIDDVNREILTYVHGASEIPDGLWDGDAPLVGAARMLADYHDATASYVPTGREAWAFGHPDKSRHEVICHNDFAPYNFVFDGNIPKAVLDFDLAGPGPRLWDVAYAVYWMTPLAFHAADLKPRAVADVDAGCRRLRLFCRTYGIEADAELLDTVDAVLTHMGDAQAADSVLGEAVAGVLARDGHFDHWRRERAAFIRHKRTLELVLAEAGI